MNELPIPADGKFRSCLADKPVTRASDRLNAYGYAEALCDFIRCADTPVTIGIQGDWGSGKTSLISLMRENLEREKDLENPVLCVCVNAWEHSLFQSHENAGEVALSLLGGLAKGLETTVALAHRNRAIDPESMKGIILENQKVSRAIAGLKIGFIFATKVAAQMVSNVIGGGQINNINIKNPSQEDAKKLEMPQMAEHVRGIRINLQKMVKNITIGGKAARIVFFIDDLDRVPPATAVEMLDVTKNIFDIEGCIFVLAIDYEVVVKGLEKKFGIRTEENEREFRQYFDKIIQIPFTMPIGAYSRKVDRLLGEALVRLGYHVGEETLFHLAQDACLASGGIPRTIKRIINTLSLLQKLNPEAFGVQSASAGDIEASFIIVSLYINFPEIMRRLMERHDFSKWTLEELNIPWQLNLDAHKSELKLREDDNLFNDPWEKVVYCLCAKDNWMKGQAPNVSRLMNRLMVVLDDNGSQDPKVLIESARLKLKNILETIRVVSVDFDKVGVAFDFDNSDRRTDQLSQFCKKIHDLLHKSLPVGSIPLRSSEYAEKLGFFNSADRQYIVTLPDEEEKTFEFFIIWRKNENTLNMGFEISPCVLTKDEIRDCLPRVSGLVSYYIEGKKLGVIKKHTPWEFKDFAARRPENYISEINDLYQAGRSLAREIGKSEREKARGK